LNDVGESKVCKIPASSDNNGRKCKHTTSVLGFNYTFLTLDLPGNWIHTWEKAVSNFIELHTTQSKCRTVKPNKL